MPTEPEIFDDNAQFSFPDDFPDVDVTLSDEVSFASPALSAAEKLRQVRELVESLEKDFQSDPQKLIMCNIMKQQVELMTICSPTITAPTSSIPASPPASLSPVSPPASSSSSPVASAAALLIRLTPVRKSTTPKVYQMKNYGVMTSDEILGKQQEICDQKGKEAEQKENRRVERVQRQEMNEKIRNMKKEKADEQRKRKAEDTQAATSQPKRRGRPPKVAKTAPADDEEWEPKKTRKSKNVSPLTSKNL